MRGRHRGNACAGVVLTLAVIAAAAAQWAPAEADRDFHASALLGRLDRQPADRQGGALGHERRHDVRDSWRGKSVSIVHFSSPFAELLVRRLQLLRLPDQRDGTRSARTARSRSSAGPRCRTPSHPDEPNFQLSDVIAGTYDSYIRELRRSREGLGAPVLPALQLGDERRLVPLGGGRQRQPARRVRRRLAPRPRHLHRGRRHQRDLGLVPQHRVRNQLQASPRSTPATPTSTGPASTATTGAQPVAELRRSVFGSTYQPSRHRSPRRSR